MTTSDALDTIPVAPVLVWLCALTLLLLFILATALWLVAKVLERTDLAEETADTSTRALEQADDAVARVAAVEDHLTGQEAPGTGRHAIPTTTTETSA